jgi:hypothetical protein
MILQVQRTGAVVARRGEENSQWTLEERGGEMTWLLRAEDWSRFKAISPTIKLNIMGKRAGRDGTVYPLGFALLDLRGIDFPSPSLFSAAPGSTPAVQMERELPVHWKVTMPKQPVKAAGGKVQGSALRCRVVISREERREAPSPQTAAFQPSSVPAPHYEQAAASGLSMTSTLRRGDIRSDPETALERAWDSESEASRSLSAGRPQGHSGTGSVQPYIHSRAASSSGLSGGGSTSVYTVSPDMDSIPIGVNPTHVFTFAMALTGLQLKPSAMGQELQRNVEEIALMRQQCWLSYKLFGVLVQTDMFVFPKVKRDGTANVINFPAIRDSFSLRSSLLDLVPFFESTPPIQIYLCTEGLALTMTEVPLSSLLEPIHAYMRANGSSPFVLDGFPGSELDGEFPAQDLLDGGRRRVTGGCLVGVAMSIIPVGKLPESGTQSLVESAASSAGAAVSPPQQQQQEGATMYPRQPARGEAQEPRAGVSEAVQTDASGLVEDGEGEATQETEDTDTMQAGMLFLAPLEARLLQVQAQVHAAEAGNEDELSVAAARIASSPDKYSQVHVSMTYSGSFQPSSFVEVDAEADEEQHIQQTHQFPPLACEVLTSPLPSSPPSAAGEGHTQSAHAPYQLAIDASTGQMAHQRVVMHIPAGFINEQGTSSAATPITPFGSFRAAIRVAIGCVERSTTSAIAKHEVSFVGTADMDAAAVHAACLVRSDGALLSVPMEVDRVILPNGDEWAGHEYGNRCSMTLVFRVTSSQQRGVEPTQPQLQQQPPAYEPVPIAPDVPAYRESRAAPVSAPPRPTPAPVTTDDFPDVENPLERHRWRLTVDVRSIRGLESGLIIGTLRGRQVSSATFLPVVVRYQYPPLGAACAVEVLANENVQSEQYGEVKSLLHPLAPRFPLVRSHPPVMINKLGERVIPRGHASLTFDMSCANLNTVLSSFPLGVYLTTTPDAADESQQAAEVGTCVVNLGSLFHTARQHSADISCQVLFRCTRSNKVFISLAAFRKHQRTEYSGDNRPPAVLRILDLFLPIISPLHGMEGLSSAGSMRVIAYLEDFGSGNVSPLEAPRISTDDIRLYLEQLRLSEAEGTAAAPSQPLELPVPGGGSQDASASPPLSSPLSGAPLDPSTLRAQLDPLLAAMVAKEESALAAWRADAEREWIAGKAVAEENWRRDSEAALQGKMQALEAAWAEREAERQTIIGSAQDSCVKVEAKLRRLLTTAETKEKEIDRIREEAKAAYEQKSAELNAVARRLREDAEHAASLAKQREAAASARVSELVNELETTRQSYVVLRKEHDIALTRIAAGPDTALRDAIASLQAERVQLEKQVGELKGQVATETKGKEEARVQVLRLAKEISRLRDEIRAREVQEAQRLKVAFLAAEERYVLEGDRAALQEIRDKVDELRDGRVTVPSREESKVASPIAGRVGSHTSGAQPASSSSWSLFPQHLAASLAAALQSAPELAQPIRADAPLPASDATDEVSTEVQRLKGERKLLTSTAPRVYTASHAVIRDIDRRVAQLQASQRSTNA